MTNQFKRALILSFFLHLVIFALAGFSGYLNGSKDKGLVHYVNLNFVGLPGGPGGGGSGTGGSGSGGQTGAKGQPAAGKQTMKELTLPEKARPASQSSIRYPEEKTGKTKPKEKHRLKRRRFKLLSPAPKPG